MYFPYFRGRQYELLALHKLVSQGLLSPKITPIVEPVKLSPTLLKTMNEFVKLGRNIAVICNPSVGSFNIDMEDKIKDSNKQRFLNLLKDDHIIKSHIMQKRSALQIVSWEEKGIVSQTDWIIINNNREFLSDYYDIFETTTPKFVLIPDESAFRRKVKRNKVLFEDRFNRCERNADYAAKDDELYSEDHLHYADDGFVGFADYSIVGKDYMESGFAPYAVAIHIVYFESDRVLRVHHFVSDSNDDIKNPAKKFYEAVEKLKIWCDDKHIDSTAGLQEFLDHYQNQTYPGLGSVKKLSLMHHLELIGKFLDEV